MIDIRIAALAAEHGSERIASALRRGCALYLDAAMWRPDCDGEACNINGAACRYDDDRARVFTLRAAIARGAIERGLAQLAGIRLALATPLGLAGRERDHAARVRATCWPIAQAARLERYVDNGGLHA